MYQNIPTLLEKAVAQPKKKVRLFWAIACLCGRSASNRHRATTPFRSTFQTTCLVLQEFQMKQRPSCLATWPGSLMRQKVKMPISLQGTHIDLQTARLLNILERGKHRAKKEERILQICRTLLPPHICLILYSLDCPSDHSLRSIWPITFSGVSPCSKTLVKKVHHCECIFWELPWRLYWLVPHDKWNGTSREYRMQSRWGRGWGLARPLQEITTAWQWQNTVLFYSMQLKERSKKVE